MKLEGKVLDEDKNLRIIIIHIVFKAINLDKSPSELIIDTREKRSHY